MVSTRESNRAKPPGTYRNYVDLGSVSSAPSDDDDGASSAGGTTNAEAGPSSISRGKGTRAAKDGSKGGTRGKGEGARARKRSRTLDVRSESSGESFRASDDDEEDEDDMDVDAVHSEASGGSGNQNEDDEDDIVDVDEDDNGSDARATKASRRAKGARALSGVPSMTRRRDLLDPHEEDVLMIATERQNERASYHPAGGDKDGKGKQPAAGSSSLNPMSYMDIRDNFPSSNAFRIIKVSLPIRPLDGSHLVTPPKLSRLSKIASANYGLHVPSSPLSDSATADAIPSSSRPTTSDPYINVRPWPMVEQVVPFLAQTVAVEHSWIHWEGGEWYPECYAAQVNNWTVDTTAMSELPPAIGKAKEFKNGTGKDKAGMSARDLQEGPPPERPEASLARRSIPAESTLVDLGLGLVGRTQPEGGYAYAETDTFDLDAMFGSTAPQLRLTHDSAQGVEEISMPPLTAILRGDGKKSRVKMLINAGKVIQKVAWCPMAESRSAQRDFKQYLAVLVPLIEFPRPADSMEAERTVVQIWSIQGHECIDPAEEQAMDVDQEEEQPAVERGAEREAMVVQDGDAGSARRGDAKQARPPPIAWGGLDDATGKCEAVIVVEAAWTDVAWMPLGCCDDLAADGSSKIGILTATCADGGIRFYCITDGLLAQASGHPYGLCTTSPILTIPNDDAAPLVLDFGSGSSLAVGFTHGVVRTWSNVPAMLQSGAPSYPATSTVVHGNAIASIAYARMPLRDASGQQALHQQPVYVLTTGRDGLTALTDTRDPDMGVLSGGATRTTNRVSWFPYAEMALQSESDHYVTTLRVRRAGNFGQTRVAAHEGIVLAMATSDFHGALASGASDGTMKWTNGVRGILKTHKMRTLAQTMYQLDWDPEHEVFHMMEDIMPQFIDHKAIASKPTTTRKQHEGAATMHNPRIAVQSIDWQRGGGLGRAGLCASGTGCGLVRVDWLGGGGAG